MPVVIRPDVVERLSRHLLPGEHLLWADAPHRTIPGLRSMFLLVATLVVAVLTLAFLTQRDVATAMRPLGDMLGRAPDGRIVATLLKLVAGGAGLVSGIILCNVAINARSVGAEAYGLSDRRLLCLRDTGTAVAALLPGQLTSLARESSGSSGHGTITIATRADETVELVEIADAAAVEVLILQTLSKPEKETS